MTSPARRLVIRASLVVALSATATSCLGVPIPIPPPMAQVQALTDCSAATADCPAGGVIVDIAGYARPGALVVVQNITRSLPNGTAYSASAFATHTASDAGAPDAGATAAGRYFIRLGPVLSMPGGPVTISQRGDQLSVRQFVEGEAGRYEASNETFIVAR
jgi:hypothetical protein